MIEQMRHHQESVDEVLRDWPTQGEQWRMWLDYHQQQVRYFQANRQVYVSWTSAFLVALVASLAITLVAGNEWESGSWLWLLVLCLLLVECGLVYYVSIYTKVLHELEAQSELLFEKTLSIATKPSVTMAQYVVNWLANLLVPRPEKGVTWKEVIDVWREN